MTNRKDELREAVWDELEESGRARFPYPPHDRIPNFAGAEEAADRLAGQPDWNAAGAIKANPDAPQLPVRRRALREGKTVYMAVPRLRDERCFLELDPDAIDTGAYDEATTVSGPSTHGRRVGPADVSEVDLIVSGSVAVTEDGARVGKGEGYSDLEFAVLREFDLVDGDVPVATTVHELQVLDRDVKPAPYDVPMDLIVTPERAIRPDGGFDTPTGVDWTELSDERIAEIPVLQGLRPDG